MAGYNRKIVSLNGDTFDWVKLQVSYAAYNIALAVKTAGVNVTKEQREELRLAQRAMDVLARPLDVDQNADTSRVPCIIEGPGVLDVLDSAVPVGYSSGVEDV